MHIVVCEDEPIYQNSMNEIIRIWKQKNSIEDIKVSVFTSSEDLLESWDKGMKGDIFFLDILFRNELSGMEVAHQIRETDSLVPIVFISSSEAYLKDGYTVRALRYLNKPIVYEEVAVCLDIAYKQYTLAHNEYLIISDAGKRLALRYSEILYIEAQSPYSLIYMQGKAAPIKIRLRFQDFNTRLPPELFPYCHRSYRVNIIHVRSVRRGTVRLSSGFELPVSRSYIDQLSQSFDSYYQEG